MVLGAAFRPCFDIRRSRLPCSHLNLKYRAADFRDISTAEAGTLQLELRDLTRTSKISFYEVSFLIAVDVSLFFFLHFYLKGK